jgi:hypothetical protein
MVMSRESDDWANKTNNSVLTPPMGKFGKGYPVLQTTGKTACGNLRSGSIGQGGTAWRLKTRLPGQFSRATIVGFSGLSVNGSSVAYTLHTVGDFT